jgi:hypothetical protein
MDDGKEGTREGKDDNEELRKERCREVCHETGRNDERRKKQYEIRPIHSEMRNNKKKTVKHTSVV